MKTKTSGLKKLTFIIAIFLLFLISCESIPQKLNRIENEYSKEVRNELEAIEDLKQLNELLNNEDEIEAIYNRLLRLDEIEQKYSKEVRDELEAINDQEQLDKLLNDEDKLELIHIKYQKLDNIEKEYSTSFREELEKVEDPEYLVKISSNSETTKLLNDIFLWKKDWTIRVLNFRYENDEIKLVINTVKYMRNSDGRRVEYLEFLETIASSNASHPLPLEEVSKIFKLSFDEKYSLEHMSLIFYEIEKYGYSFELKMSEIKDKYGIGFYKYLGTLDHDFLVNILNKENEIEEEYSIYILKADEIFLDSCILFEIDNEEIFESFTFNYLPEERIEKAKRIARRALSKYPPGFVPNHLSKVYVFGALADRGVGVAGVSMGNIILWSIDPYFFKNEARLYGGQFPFHHELAHSLFASYNEFFSEEAWLEILPDGFEYCPGSGHLWNIEGCDKYDKWSNEKRWENGFLAPYAISSLHEDFAVTAESLFSGYSWDIIDEYPQLREKVNLVLDFYHSIDPIFTEEYFREIAEY